MEEELNEHDLEERLYAMLHHVDETQNNLIDNSYQNKLDVTNFVENGPPSTLRRYWRDTNPFRKVNAPKDPTPDTVLKPPSTNHNTTPKQEKSASPKPPSPVDLSIFQSPIPENAKKTIEFLDHEDENPVILESSDEDEVVEVALPPKPTITIESSDEDELHIVKPNSPTKADCKSNTEHKISSGERAVSSSPVPSVVSSVSDEFIRGDCIALNISSRIPDKHSFDFSLHGSDLLVQNTPSKKKRRKKNKEAVTSTPIIIPAVKTANMADGCFATPRSKARNKKKNKINTEESAINPDANNSDSNQYNIIKNKTKNPYIVTEKSLPSIDVYESDSNQSAIIQESSMDQSKKRLVYEPYSSDSSTSNDKPEDVTLKENFTLHDSSVETVDLTNNDRLITIDKTGITESIVMANVTGFSESMDHGDENRSLFSKKDISKYVSSKVPSILNEGLDFDNLKGIEKVCRKRRYSLTSLRAEMEKFYNESWGGEDFNHKEIQKNMSRDKSLWAIDPKDRMPSLAQRKAKCNYCNRVGHRDDTCRQKTPICYMCGKPGHYEPRCPTKICVNCGAPNFMYSTLCRNCRSWNRLQCGECGQHGHPASHCPDLWRRYHNTIETYEPLETCTGQKKPLYCSGCSRSGHLVHMCRVTLPFSGLPINSPFVRFYRPLYHNHCANAFSQDSAITSAAPPPDRNKRLSKSPTVHENHANKKRNLSFDETERRAKSPGVKKNPPPIVESTPKNKKSKSFDSFSAKETASDFITISSNRDNEGHMIQDNEVSDSSDVVTSARIYVTKDIVNKLKTNDGVDWLKVTMEKLSVVIENADINSFLTIKGKLADQEAFQTELRDWTQNDANKSKSANADVSASEESECASEQQLPKNRNNLLRQLNNALDSLKQDLGDPKSLYKELTFSQTKHAKLLKQKVISPTTLFNSRTHINKMLKKLNTILLGQAGLADGAAHVNELQAFKEKLMNSRQKMIPTPLRKEISGHYHCVFSSNARDDYMELLKKYYLNGSAKRAKKKKRNKFMKSKASKPSKTASIPSNESAENVCVVKNPSANSGTCNENNATKLLRTLVSYRVRLDSLVRSAETKQKRNEIHEILRRLHSLIVALFRKETLTSKMLKKIKKARETAQTLLANV